MYKLQPGSNLIYDIFSNLHLCLQLIDSLIPRFIQNCHLVRIYTKTRTFIIQTIQDDHIQILSLHLRKSIYLFIIRFQGKPD